MIATTTRKWLDAHGILPVLAGAIALLMAAVLPLAEPVTRELALAAERLAPLKLALLATLATAAATGIGGLPVFFLRGIDDRARAALLGFSAGVMLAASCFSLILPSLEAGAASYGSRTTAAFVTATALAIGAIALLAADQWLPHEHFVKGREGGMRGRRLARAWLFVLAITIHNVPEGLAIGVAFGGEPASGALPLAVGIGLQNVPEGLVVALALAAAGFSPGRAALIALATGLVEPVGGLLGAAVVGIAQVLLPWGLAFAAGAMLFVVSHEMIPESHRQGAEKQASVGLILGFVTMMVFDTVLG